MRWVDEIYEAFKALGGAARYVDLYEFIERTTSRDLTAEWKATVRRTIEDHSRDSENFRAKDLFIHLDRGFWGIRGVSVDDALLAEREKQTPKQIVDKVLVRQHWRSLPSASGSAASIQIELSPDKIRPVGVWFSREKFEVELTSGLIISVPLKWFPELFRASAVERAAAELTAVGIRWPNLGVSVECIDLLQGGKTLDDGGEG